MVRKTFYLALACLLSSGCSRAIAPAELAKVEVIFAALKCAFASALVEERRVGIRRLEGAVAAGTLTLKLVHTSGTDVVGKAAAASAGPFIFAFLGNTGSITPYISREVNKTDTIKTEVPFRFLMRAKNEDVCSTLSAPQRAKIGLSDWLAKLISGMNVNIDFDPPGQVDSITFSQDFAVTEVAKGGIDFNFVFLSATMGASSVRNDVQNLTFTIAPVSAENPDPESDKSRR